MATDLSTVPVTEVRAIAISERNKRQRMSDAIAESADRVRRSVTIVVTGTAAGFARGYFGTKKPGSWSVLGADASLLSGIGSALVAAFTKGTTSAVAVDVADGALTEYGVINGLNRGIKFATDQAAKAKAGGAAVSGNPDANTPSAAALQRAIASGDAV